MGGRLKRKQIYIQLWLIPVAWQKTTQHCNAIKIKTSPQLVEYAEIQFILERRDKHKMLYCFYLFVTFDYELVPYPALSKND